MESRSDIDPKPTEGNFPIRKYGNHGKRSSDFKAQTETTVTEEAMIYKEKNRISKGVGKGMSKGENGKSLKGPVAKSKIIQGPVYRPKPYPQSTEDPISAQLAPLLKPGGPNTIHANILLSNQEGSLAEEGYYLELREGNNDHSPVLEEVVNGGGQQWKKMTEVDPAH
jgi:hypothetical protein